MFFQFFWGRKGARGNGRFFFVRRGVAGKGRTYDAAIILKVLEGGFLGRGIVMMMDTKTVDCMGLS